MDSGLVGPVADDHRCLFGVLGNQLHVDLLCLEGREQLHAVTQRRRVSLHGRRRRTARSQRSGKGGRLTGGRQRRRHDCFSVPEWTCRDQDAAEPPPTYRITGGERNSKSFYRGRTSSRGLGRWGCIVDRDLSHSLHSGALCHGDEWAFLLCLEPWSPTVVDRPLTPVARVWGMEVPGACKDPRIAAGSLPTAPAAFVHPSR